MKANKTSLVITILAVIAIAAIAIVVGITTSTKKDSELSVVATFYPLQDFALAIGGTKVSVENMTPAGSEPHDFEPTAKSLAEASKSQIFIYNGTGMEPWVKDFLSDYSGQAVSAAAGLSLLGHEEDEEEEEHEELTSDPHFWLDPNRAQIIVDNILVAFKQADPANANYYDQNATDYKAKLVALDDDFRSGLGTCSLDTIVTTHNAFAYVADRYQFKVVSIAGISPDEEPSPAKLAEITDLVREKNISYIFLEELASSKLADTLANETGVQTAVLDPIEGLSADNADTGQNYLSLQRQNLATLRTALVCE
jgi:zinc transport system substrate-binding protein